MDFCHFYALLNIIMTVVFEFRLENRARGICGEFSSSQYNIDETLGLCYGLLVEGNAEGFISGT